MTEEILNRPAVVRILCEALNLSPRHVKERVMKRPDFPEPARKVGLSEAYRKEDIQRWLGV